MTTLPVASIEDVVFHISNALYIPVLVAAVCALGLVIIELGALAVELLRRKRRDRNALDQTASDARDALSAGDRALAGRRLAAAATSAAMLTTFGRILDAIGPPIDSDRVAKSIADFDIQSLRRLERTRLLVRAGPALGLMGTLIPLSPALSGLATGNVKQLSDNLRVAFSVTVIGLLTGMVAFGITLVRDRMYAQDLADVEYVTAVLEKADPGMLEKADAAAAREPKPSPAERRDPDVLGEPGMATS